MLVLYINNRLSESSHYSLTDLNFWVLRFRLFVRRIPSIWRVSSKCCTMTINYYQLERKVTSVHIGCDPTALYACESMVRTAMIAHRLDFFHRRCLRTIIGISCCDHTTNEEMMRRAGMEQLQYIVTTRRRKMAGHVLRLQGERPAHTAMYWVAKDGKLNRGTPNKTWRSTFKEDLEEMGVSCHRAHMNASERG